MAKVVITIKDIPNSHGTDIRCEIDPPLQRGGGDSETAAHRVLAKFLRLLQTSGSTKVTEVNGTKLASEIDLNETETTPYPGDN